MNYITTLLPITSILSIALLAGCTSSQVPGDTTNQEMISNTNDAAVEETNKNVNNEVVESNENGNINVTNTTTEEAAEIDTADLSSEALAQEDWLTYTNEEYGFSFRYPEDWEATSKDRYEYVPGLSLLQSVTIIEGSAKSNDINFSLTDLDISSLINAIELSDTLSDGSSLANVNDVTEVFIAETIAFKTSHQTAIGIPINFYYVPLKSNLALFVYYREFEDERTQESEDIINTLKIN